MAVAPNHQKLLIPGKNYRGVNDPYARDARAIEMWANEGIVRKLIAGTNITLLPASGVDEGQGIKIAASGGGGGGGKWGQFSLTSGMDATITPPAGGGTSAWLGVLPNPVNKVLTPLVPPFGVTQVSVSPATSFYTFTFVTHWIVFPVSGKYMAILPIVGAPSYTGTAIGVIIGINAWSNDSNQAMSVHTQTTIASGASISPNVAAYTVDDTFGADLTFVDAGGVGTGEGGFLSAGGGGAVFYLCSTQLSIDIADDVVFT